MADKDVGNGVTPLSIYGFLIEFCRTSREEGAAIGAEAAVKEATEEGSFN